MNQFQRWWIPWFRISAVTLATALTVITGCEKKEKVMEIQAPGFNLEVNKTTSPTGDKGVEVKTNQGDKIEIDATNKKTD